MKTAMNDHEDVKPPRGFIPEVPALNSSATASHGFFKVFMIVEGEEMTPMLIEKPQDMLTIQRFVAIPGKSFYCRVELSRAPPEGVLYGCRVYIDKGGLDNRHVFDVAKGVTEDVGPAESSSVDEADHYFWFAPGKTTYSVKGYFGDSKDMFQFKFGELPRGSESYDENLERVKEKITQIGVIRFQFSRVEKMVKRRHNGWSHGLPALPSGAADFSDGMLYRKGVHLAVKPGKRLKRGVPTKERAILEREICYESRVYFNDRFGYQEMYQSKGHGIYDEPSRLRALPLVEFTTTSENRKFFLDKFVVWLQNKRFARVEDVCAVKSAVEPIEEPKVNEAVATEDLVHFINYTLSPAASYILCTGKVHPGNFGEKLIQRKPATKEHDDFFQEKENGLVSFFGINPDRYELVEAGRDKQNRLLYTVKMACVEILDDSDSD